MIEINKENLKQKKFVIEIQPKHFKRAIGYDNVHACPLHYALCDVFKANSADQITVEQNVVQFKLKNKKVTYKIKGKFKNETTVNLTGYTVDELIARAKRKQAVGTFTVVLKRKKKKKDGNI